MPKIRTIQNSLNAGELSPRLRGRTDIPRYNHGLETCRNAIPMVWGGVRRTPGTRFVAMASGSVVKLIDFPIVIDGQIHGYIIELGNSTLRIHANGAQILSGGSPYALATPWPGATLNLLRYTVSANVMYLLHPGYAPRRLTRNDSDTDWTLEELPIAKWPMMRPPETDDITIQPSGTIGTVTLTASANYFTSNHVGVRIGLNKGVVTITAVSSPTSATGTVGDTTLSGDDSTKDITDNMTVAFASPFEIPAYPPTESQYTTLVNQVTAPWSFGISTKADYQGNTLTTTPAASLPSGVSFSKTRTVNKLSGTSADKDWTEQAWSGRHGWPSSGAFHEQRLMLGGSRAYPTYVWGSASGDPLDFDIGTADDDAFAFNLSAASTSIFHLVATGDITVFTGSAELTMRGSSDEALSPTNVQVKNRTPHGCSNVRPVQNGGQIHFVTPSGRKLRGFGYQYTTDSYVAGDVALVSDHLINSGGGIVDMAYALEPYSLMWLVTAQGGLLSLTLDKEQEVTAWASHGGDNSRYTSVATVMGDDGQEQVWFSVQRLVGGVWTNFIEILDEDAHTNSCVIASGDALTSVAGLGHLDGCSVDVKADGFYFGRKTVSSGSIALDVPADQVEVGLPYTTTIKDLPPEMAGAQTQSIQGLATAVNKIRVRLHESQGCRINGEQIPFRSFPSPNVAVQPWTGDKTIINLGRGTEPELAQVTIVQDLPFGLTVLAIIKDMAVNG